MEKKKKIQKIYLTYYDLLIAQGLWQVHYQILNKKYIYIYIKSCQCHLIFLPEKMKMEKIEKLVANLHDKTEYVIHIRNFKQALNHG